MVEMMIEIRGLVDEALMIETIEGSAAPSANLVTRMVETMTGLLLHQNHLMTALIWRQTFSTL